MTSTPFFKLIVAEILYVTYFVHFSLVRGFFYYIRKYCMDSNDQLTCVFRFFRGSFVSSVPRVIRETNANRVHCILK